MTTKLPIGAGVSLKMQHFEVAAREAEVGLWFEVHTENFMIDGGPRLRQLAQMRENFDVSFHGVGASLGGVEPPHAEHLAKVKALVQRFEPAQVSEHAVWSSFGDCYFADLLPLPRTKEALERLVDGVDRYQSAIGREILIENPSNYLPLPSEMDEPEFLNEVSQRSGCGLLLDLNNLYVSERNCGIDARDYVQRLNIQRVGEIHVAGYDVDPSLGERLLIDSHAAAVSEPVWQLLDFTLDVAGAKPVLLERDGKVPEFTKLMVERTRAQAAIENASADRKSA